MAAIQARWNQSKSFYLPSALNVRNKVQRRDDKLSISSHTWYKDSKASHFLHCPFVFYDTRTVVLYTCLSMYTYRYWTCWSCDEYDTSENNHISLSVKLCFTLSSARWLLCKCQRPQPSPVWKAQGKQTCTWRSTATIATFSLVSVTPVSCCLSRPLG